MLASWKGTKLLVLGVPGRGCFVGLYWSVADVPQPHKKPLEWEQSRPRGRLRARAALPGRMSPGSAEFWALFAASPLMPVAAPFARQLKWAISYQGKLSLLLSADGANILQSDFTYEKHLCEAVMTAVCHDGTWALNMLFQLGEGKIGTFWF